MNTELRKTLLQTNTGEKKGQDIENEALVPVVSLPFTSLGW